jgi:cyanuric acid amidohydrolase
MPVHVISYDTAHPGDTSDLLLALARFDPLRIRRLALLVKTDGNSDLNDFSRSYGLQSAGLAVEQFGGRALLERSTFLFSSGCEGAMTPFGQLFVDVADAPAAQAVTATHASALAFGCARSRPLTGDEIGTLVHADVVTQTVLAAMADAGVAEAEVSLVIVKTPVMSRVPATARQAVNKRITSAYSKAVAALGAGVALAEVERAQIRPETFDADPTLHARRAMVFSGNEVDYVEVLLLANRPGAAGDLYVQTGAMRDLLDAGGLRRMFLAAGCRIGADGEVEDGGRVVATLVKAGATSDGRVRGRRTTIKSSHIDMDKHVRAAVSGVLGSVLGDTRAFISANTVHQAPPGGGLCACVVRRSAGE